jgi:xylulokinase
MAMVAGIDCSTQSTKVVVCDSETGAVVKSGQAPHPDATEIDPEEWWSALEAASGGLLQGVAAIAVGGQQHGMVVVDEAGEVIRPALLWNDTRSASAAADLVAELGAVAWADAVGSVPMASFTVTKLRWFATHEPSLAAQAAQVMLPHDWVTWRLTGSAPDGVVTDRGDASGTGYWSPASGAYRKDLLTLAFGRSVGVPRVLAPREPAGETASGAVVGPGTGDNMAAALALGVGPGDVVVSIGTSGTVFAVHGEPTADPTGIVAGFADATGRFLPLLCTLNAARVLDAAAAMLRVSHAELASLAAAAPPGSGGLVLLPYLDGERTPNLPDATGSLHGLTRATMTPPHVARAAVEGMLCGLADGVDALRARGIPVHRVLLIGGGARSAAVQAIAPDLFGVPVFLPEPDEYVALGAARQAAWTLSGAESPPAWAVPSVELPAGDPTRGSVVRERYAEVARGR